MRNSIATTCALAAQLVFFLLFGAAIFDLQRSAASAQSLAPPT